MPRPRLSYDQAKARGADQVNAGRFADRKNAPPTQGVIGLPPKSLTAAEKKVWKELAIAIPDGVAGESDRIAVEIASRLLHQFRTNAHTMQSSRISLLMNMLSRLGLDPQARTRLHVAPTAEVKPTDPLDQYMTNLTYDSADSIQ
jgi:hypothetical protein